MSAQGVDERMINVQYYYYRKFPKSRVLKLAVTSPRGAVCTLYHPLHSGRRLACGVSEPQADIHS